MRECIRVYTFGDMEAEPERSWPVRMALEILDEEGFDAVGVRSVAARAGRTPMAVYRHVSDARDLRRRMVRCVFEHWESRVYPVLDEPNPATRLRRYADLYATFAKRHPHRYDVLFVLPHGLGTHRFPSGFRAGPASTFEILTDAVAEAMDAGVVPSGDPVEVGIGYWATAHGLVMLRRSGRFPDPDTFAELYGRALDRLLSAPSGTRELDT